MPRLFGYDYRTGEVRRTIDVDECHVPGHHLRCYRSKATDQFIIYPKRGAEFLDLDGDNHMRHDWLRGSCRFGIVPCNGLLYTPPDQCFCYIGAKMDGLVATSSADTPAMLDPHAPERLFKGPAYGAWQRLPTGVSGGLAGISLAKPRWCEPRGGCLPPAAAEMGGDVGRQADAADRCDGPRVRCRGGSSHGSCIG